MTIYTSDETRPLAAGLMVLGQDRRSALPLAGYTTLSRPFYAFFLM
ncbi:hypothetical protein [Mycobacterium sp.]